ncbi:MAG TPA: HTH-type transcriptional repressor FabR [Acidimicrobiales bacterium]|nr:HTH-type transcriptional repressor FabR [Acidimicrobiales bacterium]
MAPRPPSSPGPSSKSRDERKSRTRRALLDSALQQMRGEHGFSDLSLREVAKSAGVVPAAFYRHFPSMEALGMVLVDESFATLRQTMRDLRTAPLPTEHLVRESVETFLGYVQEHELHFRFIAKERYGGSTPIRMAIRQEVRLFTSELATDLARTPGTQKVTSADLRLIAGLIVQTVSLATELVLDTDPNDTISISQIVSDTDRQLRIILAGAAVWRSGDGSMRRTASP